MPWGLIRRDKAAYNLAMKQRIREGALNGVAHIYSGGTCGPLPDPKVGPTIENLFRLKKKPLPMIELS